jgi:hypothetical protein
VRELRELKEGTEIELTPVSWTPLKAQIRLFDDPGDCSWPNQCHGCHARRLPCLRVPIGRYCRVLGVQLPREARQRHDDRIVDTRRGPWLERRHGNGARNLHACAALSDGTVKCWGNNTFGELGTQPTTSPEMCNGVPRSTTPVVVRW